ncbi:hypothetical protein FRC20_003849 [Serendipita sp. 405]|nr:hypothetical protein FRC16_003625 [Serendipita sp. 398]KAG8879090.1 hypothetical protein FRC20_003849 [Serendipita sp. 405]
MAFRSPPSSNPVSPILGPSHSIANARVPMMNLHAEGSTSALQHQQPSPPLTLVIPTIRTQKRNGRRALEAVSPKTGKPYPNRLKGHRPTQSASLDVIPPPPIEENWVAPLGKFDIEQDVSELEGYQMYAVEKWVVDRSKFMKVVVVFTGDPKDVISVTVVTPSSKLTNEQAQMEYDNACRLLRRDGARPRQTVLGVILTTNLASFRSDLNIVRIPGGDYLADQDKLYVNINLLRLGCGGRTALTLESPSESIQERFKQLYSIPAIAVQRLTFEHVVLAFVKLVQSALMIYDLLDMSDERDGLLGDATVDSVQRWTLEIGEKLRELRLEPAERILDPPVVASILSVVASTRSKLLALLPTAANVPKDPFQHPRAFTEALAIVSPAHLTRTGSTGFPQAFLSAALVDHINRQYKRKTTESKPAFIALGEKTLATLRPSESLSMNFSSSIVGSSRTAQETVVRETSDLISFTKSQSVISKDPIESLQFVWTGKMGPGLLHAKHAQEIEERMRAEERDLENKSDARSGEDDEGVIGKGISALRQEISSRLPSLPSLPVGVGRKKPSMEGSSHLFVPGISSARVSPDINGPRHLYGNDGQSSPFIPGEARALSADEGLGFSRRPILSSFGMHSAVMSSNFSVAMVPGSRGHRSVRHKAKSLDLGPFQKAEVEFKPQKQKVSTRWIPIENATMEVHSDDEGVPERIRKGRPAPGSGNQSSTLLAHDTLKRRQSFDDVQNWRSHPCLTTEQMRIDIHYSAALNEVSRRKRRLHLAVDALKELNRPLLLTREILRTQITRQKGARDALNSQVDEILPAVEDLAPIKALQLRSRIFAGRALPRDAPFKANAITSAETLKSAKYKTANDISRIGELRTDVKKHREQYWQQRRLAYLPPETKSREEDLTLSLGSKCPFLWSLQTIYKLMLLTILWAGMFRRGEIQSSTDDGWRRSTVFGTRLDAKGRTQADIDTVTKEEEEDRGTQWSFKTLPISAQSFASL